MHGTSYATDPRVAAASYAPGAALLVAETGKFPEVVDEGEGDPTEARCANPRKFAGDVVGVADERITAVPDGVPAPIRNEFLIGQPLDTVVVGARYREMVVDRVPVAFSSTT